MTVEKTIGTCCGAGFVTAIGTVAVIVIDPGKRDDFTTVEALEVPVGRVERCFGHRDASYPRYLGAAGYVALGQKNGSHHEQQREHASAHFSKWSITTCRSLCSALQISDLKLAFQNSALTTCNISTFALPSTNNDFAHLVSQQSTHTCENDVCGKCVAHKRPMRIQPEVQL